MKKKILTTAVLLVAMLMQLMLPINDATAEAASMKLSKKEIILTAGSTEQLSVTNMASASTVKWSTSNQKIATVSSKGKVTAKAKGNATITANVTTKAGKKSKLTCKVKVTAAAKSKYRYVGVVYEGPFDLTFSKADSKGIPTELIIFGEKMELRLQRGDASYWVFETSKGGYMEIYAEDNYNRLTIKGNYGGDYTRTTRTNNEKIKTDQTVMKINDSLEIQDGDNSYYLNIAFDKSNTYYARKTIGTGNKRKETREAYSVTKPFKGEGWSFDCTTCTLTLDNAKITNIYTDLSCDITVKLIGENIVENDLPDGNMRSYQVAFFGSRDGIDRINITFTGDGSVNFCRPDWYKDDDTLRDSIGLRTFDNPLILEGSCTVIVNGRNAGISSYDFDITVGKNCTLSILSEVYGIYPSSPSDSRKLSVDGTFIAKVTGDSEYATVFQGNNHTADFSKIPIVPEMVIGGSNRILAGESEETAVAMEKSEFQKARYFRIGKE